MTEDEVIFVDSANFFHGERYATRSEWPCWYLFIL